MPPGTIYMYFARGGDSLNVSVRGAGNAVLIKAGLPHVDEVSGADALETMRRLNPARSGALRPVPRLCAGQTLLCRALGLRVADWTGRLFDREAFFVEDVGYVPGRVVRARRLGIPRGRDEHLMYRFLDHARLDAATANPLSRRRHVEGADYRIERGPRRAP